MTGGSRPERPLALMGYFFDFERLDDEDTLGLLLATADVCALLDFPDFAVPPPRSACRRSADWWPEELLDDDALDELDELDVERVSSRSWRSSRASRRSSPRS